MSPTKRRRLSEEQGDGENISDILIQPAEDGVEDEGLETSSRSSEAGSASGNESIDTDDEIVEAQRNQKSKKTQKRKRRATSPSRFGATLQSLLNTNTPASQPLSLTPSVAKKRKDEILEVKAKKVLEGEKKEKEEKNHITDVIGVWGGESERSLRKVAQRGVVKLFNAIQQTQSAAVVAQEEAKSLRGSGKATLPAPAVKVKGKKNTTQPGSLSNPNSSLNQNTFLEMIKSGGFVSKV